jgi:hypothetical protein
VNPHLQASIYGVRNPVHAEETRQNRRRFQQATCAAGAGERLSLTLAFWKCLAGRQQPAR